MMESQYYFAALKNGRAEVVTAPSGLSPNDCAQDCGAEGYCILDAYIVKAEAEQRCDVENDLVKRELLVEGKLRVHKTG